MFNKIVLVVILLLTTSCTSIHVRNKPYSEYYELYYDEDPFTPKEVFEFMDGKISLDEVYKK